MKLWEKNRVIDERIEKFTVGDDPYWDSILIPYDIAASRAHVKMLCKMGYISIIEEKSLIEGLNTILEKWNNGNFPISIADEDCHTAIENALVKLTGEAGKKIHTGRSRNDQVLTALRLLMKDSAESLISGLENLKESMNVFRDKFGHTPIPGYTHTRKAMPTDVACWTGAYIENMNDDQFLMQQVMALIDKNPLGTGAGYGLPIPLDRDMTTKELAFRKIQTNPIHTQHSRTKYEGLLLTACSNVMADLNRMASDLIFYTMPENSFFVLPVNMTTGSSIMPQKKNPDVLELLRGKYHQVFAAEMQVRQNAISLISGYHRDMQTTKAPLMKTLKTVEEALHITSHLFRNLSVNKNACEKAMAEELFATEKAYRLVVEKNIPFRDAYRIISRQYTDEKAE